MSPSTHRLVVRSARRAAFAAVLALATVLATWSAVPPTAGAESNESARYRIAAGSIAAGAFHTCALLTSGQVRCWGDNQYGQLGYGHTDAVGDDETPASHPPVALGGRATAITAGYWQTCALLATGHLRCWGANNAGQLGYGHINQLGDDETPASEPVVPAGGKVRTRAATSLTVRPTPRRDRRPRYVYRLTGRVTGAFVTDAATCTGKVTITVTKGRRKVAATRTAVRSDCGYRARVAITGKRLDTRRKVTLRARVVYPGSTNLTRSARTIRLIAN